MADDDQQMRGLFGQLMQMASDIKNKAIEKETLEQAEINAEATGGQGIPVPVDYDKINQKYANIEQLFDPYSKMPDPVRYDPMIREDLTAALEQLSQQGGASTDPIGNRQIKTNVLLSGMKTADGFLGDWNGEAALRFKENFLDPFPDITGNQFMLVAALRGTLEAHQAMWDKARISIARIAKNTKDALDHVDGTDKNDWSFALSVLSAVGAIGGAFVTAGASLPFSIIGAVASAGNATAAGVTATVSGGGGSVDDVVNSMKHAMDQLKQEIEQTEHAIADKVRGIANSVNGQQDYFVAKRPALAGMHGHDLTGDSGMGSVNG